MEHDHDGSFAKEHSMRIRDVVSILFLKNDFEEGEDNLLAKHRLPDFRDETTTARMDQEDEHEEEEEDEDEDSSSSGSEVDSEDEPELRERREDNDPYSPKKRPRSRSRFLSGSTGSAGLVNNETQSTEKEGDEELQFEIEEEEREVASPIRSDSSSQLFNVVESNRCRGVYIAASQISKTIVGERANTIYFRMDSQKSVLVALQEIANVTVALICDAEFLNEEDAKALLSDGVLVLTNVLGKPVHDLSSWRIQRRPLQDSINNILDHCWIPLKNTTGTRSMELLEGFNSTTMKDVVNDLVRHLNKDVLWSVSDNLCDLLPFWMMQTQVHYTGACIFLRDHMLYNIAEYEERQLDCSVQIASAVKFFDHEQFAQTWRRIATAQRPFHFAGKELKDAIRGYKRYSLGTNNLYARLDTNTRDRALVCSTSHPNPDRRYNVLCAAAVNDFVIMFSFRVFIPTNEAVPSSAACFGAVMAESALYNLDIFKVERVRRASLSSPSREKSTASPQNAVPVVSPETVRQGSLALGGVTQSLNDAGQPSSNLSTNPDGVPPSGTNRLDISHLISALKGNKVLMSTTPSVSGYNNQRGASEEAVATLPLISEESDGLRTLERDSKDQGDKSEDSVEEPGLFQQHFAPWRKLLDSTKVSQISVSDGGFVATWNGSTEGGIFPNVTSR